MKTSTVCTLALGASLCCNAETIMTLTQWDFTREGKPTERVEVPHDWAIAGPFDESIDRQTVAIVENGEKKASEKTGRTGALPFIGKGEYATKVNVPVGTKNVAFVFEAAMSEPEVYFDGEKIGEWKYGYSTFCVKVPAEKAKAGEHDLKVKLQNRPYSSRWYPGAGLIRPVRMVLDADDPEEAVLGRAQYRGKMPKIELRPWREGASRDEVGFFIDGKRVDFKGVCMHHDLGPLGAAWNKEAFRRQVRKLKDFGVNAIRTSHNPPAPEQLDVCDEEGIYVMAESFDSWASRKCANGYNLFFKDWWKRDLAQLVKVCRDHPCVVMYSIGNEVHEQTSTNGLVQTKAMIDYMHSLDPSRPVVQGLNHWPGAANSGVAGAMDIPSLNYNLGSYELAHKLSKTGLVLGSETASSYSSRGEYCFPFREMHKGENYHANGQCSDYDMEYAPWANMPDDDRAMQEDHPWVIGEFVWTGFDYLGEPCPYDRYWPSRSSYFGFFDLAGLPKNRAYLYRSYWNEKEHTLHVLPHWTWPGREGQVTPVEVYTDFNRAELFINGKSQGVRRKEKSSRFDRFRLRWLNVVYEPGELKVVALNDDGTKAMEKTVRTAGSFASYRQESERYGKFEFVTVSAVDANGELIPSASEELSFKVTGGAKFKCVCNGDATSLESFAAPKMKLFHGQLVVVLEVTDTAPWKLAIE